MKFSIWHIEEDRLYDDFPVFMDQDGQLWAQTHVKELSKMNMDRFRVIVHELPEVVDRLADAHAPIGDCPPEDLKPWSHTKFGLKRACDMDADCRQCWIETVNAFLELEQ